MAMKKTVLPTTASWVIGGAAPSPRRESGARPPARPGARGEGVDLEVQVVAGRGGGVVVGVLVAGEGGQGMGAGRGAVADPQRAVVGGRPDQAHVGVLEEQRAAGGVQVARAEAVEV